MSSVFFLWPSAVLASTFAAACGLFAQSSDPHCDPNIGQRTSFEEGYQEREGWCEGLYVAQYGLGRATIIGVHDGVDTLQVVTQSPIDLYWASPPAEPSSLGPVKLVARATDAAKPYYRMDKTATSGETRFSWPPGVRNRIEVLSRRAVGVIAVSRARLEGVRRELYLPVRTTPERSHETSGEYLVWIRPDVPLRRVSATITRLDADDEWSRAVSVEHPSTLHPSSAYSLSIAKDGLPGGGVYKLNLRVEPVAGETNPLDVYLLHSP